MTKKNKTRSRANSTGETQKTQDRVPRPGTHDPFFKSLFSIEENAWSLLRAQLPEEIWELLADTPPKIIDASFIAEDLSNCQADLLLEVELTSGDPAFDYILVAHKSYQDEETVLQMIGYMVRIWQKFIRAGKGEEGFAARARSLPPIISLPGYSGSGPWKRPISLADMMATDAPELTFLQGPNLILRSWSLMSAEELSCDPIPQVGLITLTGRALEDMDRVEKALQGNRGLQKLFAL